MTDAEDWHAREAEGLWFVPTVTCGAFCWLDPPPGLEPAEGGPSVPGVPLRGWASYPPR